MLVPFAQRQTCSSLEELVTRRCTLFFLLFRRFLHPNQDQAVYSKVLVNFRGTRFPSFLDEESGSFSYVERQVRFELVEHEGFEERKEEGRKEGRKEGRQAGRREGGRKGGRESETLRELLLAVSEDRCFGLVLCPHLRFTAGSSSHLPFSLLPPVSPLRVGHTPPAVCRLGVEGAPVRCCRQPARFLCPCLHRCSRSILRRSALGLRCRLRACITFCCFCCPDFSCLGHPIRCRCSSCGLPGLSHRLYRCCSCFRPGCHRRCCSSARRRHRCRHHAAHRRCRYCCPAHTSCQSCVPPAHRRINSCAWSLRYAFCRHRRWPGYACCCSCRWHLHRSANLLYSMHALDGLILGSILRRVRLNKGCCHSYYSSMVSVPPTSSSADVWSPLIVVTSATASPVCTSAHCSPAVSSLAGSSSNLLLSSVRAFGSRSLPILAGPLFLQRTTSTSPRVFCLGIGCPGAFRCPSGERRFRWVAPAGVSFPLFT